MTAQPTPAPWKLLIATIEGATVATIEPADDDPYRGMIARLQSAEHINGIGADEMIANAQLLVAARDMLAALEFIEENNDRLHGRKMAREAIARARGKA